MKLKRNALRSYLYQRVYLCNLLNSILHLDWLTSKDDNKQQEKQKN